MAYPASYGKQIWIFGYLMDDGFAIGYSSAAEQFVCNNCRPETMRSGLMLGGG